MSDSENEDCVIESAPSESAYVGKRKKLALIWSGNFFKKIDSTEAECNTCRDKIKTPTGSTSGLVRHLKKHKIVQEEYMKLDKDSKKKREETNVGKSDTSNAVRQLSLEETFTKKQKYAHNDVKAKTITKKLVRMIATDYQPFSIVEDRGFRHFVEELEPKYDIPSRTTLSRSVLPHLYTEERDKLIKEIFDDVNDGLESISITTDMWTSRGHESYISLTCHYVDSKFCIKSHVLENSHFPGSHNASAVCEKMVSMIEGWDLPVDTIPVYVITDNARNLTAAFNRTSWTHLQCFAHTLQLSISDAKGEHAVDSILAKGRAIVGHYRHSNLARERLQNLQRQLNLPVHEMLPMVATRWNSEFIMLSRLVEQQAAISAELGTTLSVDCFTANEWRLAAGLVQVLHPIDHATKELCYDTLPTLSAKIPLLHGIESMIGIYIKKNVDKTGVSFAKSLLKAIKARFPSYRTVKEDMIAMVLDPRFKAVLLSEQDKNLCLRYIASDVSTGTEDTVSETEPNSRENDQGYSVWENFEKLKEKKSLSESNLSPAEQMKKYWKEPVIDRKKNPLIWWQENYKRFPSLAPLARHYIGIPATQVASERQFSCAGNTVSVRRENLSAEHVEQLVFLHGRFSDI